MKAYEDIVQTLLSMDNNNNILSIELQSDAENSIEINVIYEDYDSITEQIWDYTLSFDSPELHIDNFGKDQEIPKAKKVLYKKEG